MAEAKAAPSTMLFLPDMETEVDLLYFEPIATALTDLIEGASEKPITIGVHGDWGAGKSSIMKMVERRLAGREDVLVIHFDGWRFQGFDDAKTVLLETIIEELRTSATVGSKIKDEALLFLKRIKWLKVARKAGEVGFNYLIGMPTPGQVKGALASLVADPTAAIKSAEVKEAIEGLSEYLDDRPEETVAQTIHAFMAEFRNLLRKTGLKKLVVLIDDLDRCLPSTTIETLEAIRLFLFVEGTAFVIAADEGMIEYAVRHHFPDLPASTSSTSYARNYLEKLIQTPLRLSPLGVEEVKVYVTLLLVQSITGEDHPGFKKLIEVAREIIRQPWLTADIKLEQVQELDASKREQLTAAYQLALQIGRAVGEGTSGNPRQVKRFLNALAVRQAVAAARGLGAIVKRDVLAKLMLAERFRPDFYNAISLATLKSNTGTVPVVGEFEKASAALKNGSDKAAEHSKEVSEWLTDDWLCAWSAIEPSLAAVDLRPYAFVARDRRVQLGKGTGSEAVATVLAAAAGGPFALSGAEDIIKKLLPADVETIFNEWRGMLLAASDFKQKPEGFDGLCKLVQHHPQLQLKFATLLGDLDATQIGPWAAAGWRPETWAAGLARSKAREVVRNWVAGGNKQLKTVAAPLAKKLGDS